MRGFFMPILFLTYIDDDNDKSLFEDIYYSYRKQMVIFANTLLGNEEDAQDAVSDVFLRIAQKNWDVVRKIDNETDLRNYLLKATKNMCLNKIKSNKREIEVLDEIADCNTDNAESLSDNAFIEEICNEFEYDDVVTAIRLLDEKYRDVLYCYYVMEMTAPEAANALNRKLSTTKQQLVRGKKLLLNLLKEKREEKKTQ